MKRQEPWSEPLRLSELSHGPVSRRLEADGAARARIAHDVGVDAVTALTAEVEAAPWLDGVRLTGRWRAEVAQTCGVTLEPLQSRLSGDFSVRAVPRDSPAAPRGDGEIGLDLEAEDPPDVLEADRVDLAAYVVEHLALEVDPYPRKPGAEFEPPAAEPEASPFAALRALKPRGAT